MSDMRVVLIGKTGAGKSAVGNSLLTTKVFKSSASASSATKVCEDGNRILPNGTRLTVVDTPGIFDTHKSNTESCAEIGRCFDFCSPGPHMFLLVLKVGRFTQEEMASVTHLTELFGEIIFQYLIIVFTGKDSLEDEDLTVNEYLGDIPTKLIDLIIKCGNRVVAINNREAERNREADVNAILNLVASEIREHGGNCYYSKQMFDEIRENAIRQQIVQEERQRWEENERLEAKKRRRQAKHRLEAERQRLQAELERQMTRQPVYTRPAHTENDEPCTIL